MESPAGTSHCNIRLPDDSEERIGSPSSASPVPPSPSQLVLTSSPRPRCRPRAGGDPDAAARVMSRSAYSYYRELERRNPNQSKELLVPTCAGTMLLGETGVPNGVITGLVPVIHVLSFCDRPGVDGRDKPGHDETRMPRPVASLILTRSPN